MDGWLTLGTRLDTKQLEKELKEQEEKLKEYEKEAEDILKQKSELEIDTTKAEKQVEDLNKKIEDLKKEREKYNKTGFAYEYASEQITEAYNQQSSILEEINNRWDDINNKAEQNANNQALIRGQMQQTKNEMDKIKQIQDVDKQLDSIGKKTSSILKKIAQWGLAIVGIKGIYSAIKQSMGIIAQYDKQISTDLEYMKYAIAMSMKPIIEWLIKALYKIMQYVNYISNAWFGYNLFKDAGVKDFEKSLNKSNKTAKELKKTLSGFDEVNVLQDTSSASDNANIIPSLDLSKVEQIDVPDWVKWIADHKDEIIQLAEVVGIAFGIGKISSILSNISMLFGASGSAGSVGGVGLKGLFSSIAAIAAIAAGIKIIIDCGKKIWDDLNHLGDEIDGITEKAKGYNKAFKEAVDPTDVEVMNNLIETQNVNFQGAVDMLKKANGPLGKLGHNAKSWAKSSLAVVENSKATVDKLYEEYKLSTTTKERKQEILEILEGMKEKQRDIITDAQEWTDETDNAYDAFFDTSHIIHDIKDDLGIVEEQTEGIHETGIDFIDNLNRKMGLLKDTEEDLQTPWGELRNTAIGILNEISNYKIGDKKFNMKAILDTGVINKALDAYDKFKANSTGLWGQSITLLLNPLMNNLRQYRAASGAIVNLPGHGVPVGNNVLAGEKGREGVIPLTDPNAMAQLGEEIGKWVNIAIDNRMVVDGRVLATATNNQINKENFLLNR